MVDVIKSLHQGVDQGRLQLGQRDVGTEGLVGKSVGEYGLPFRQLQHTAMNA